MEIKVVLIGLCVNSVLSAVIPVLPDKLNQFDHLKTKEIVQKSTVEDCQQDVKNLEREHLQGKDTIKSRSIFQFFKVPPSTADSIKLAMEEVRRMLFKGVPCLGIQSIEPLRIPSIRMRQHNVPRNGFKYDAWLSNINIAGLTNFTLNTLDIFPEELQILANISVPLILINGEYVLIGDFQMLPVESTGKMSANFSSCTAKLMANVARVHRRMVIRDAKVNLHCAGDTHSYLENIHSSTHDMELITQHIISKHAEDILKEMQPAVETSFAMVIEDLANKFLKHKPYEGVKFDH